jgi:hypothetical protein
MRLDWAWRPDFPLLAWVVQVGVTALHAAAATGHGEVVGQLLAAGADVNAAKKVRVGASRVHPQHGKMSSCIFIHRVPA